MAISLAYPLPRLYSCDIISLGIAHNQLEGIPIGYIHQYEYCCKHLAISERINTIFVFFEKMVQAIAKWNKVYQVPSLSFKETNKFSSSIFVIAKTFFPI